MKLSRFILLTFTILLLAIVVTAGCGTPARKPTQPMLPTTPSPQNAVPAPIAKPPVNPISPMEVTNQAVTAANRVRGVKNASAFIADRIVYIGLELQENTTNQESAEIEKTVSNQINSMNSGYPVRVTADLNTVVLIKTVAQGIAQGQPMSDFNSEVHRVTLILTPKGSTLLHLQLKVYHIFMYTTPGIRNEFYAYSGNNRLTMSARRAYKGG